MRVLVAVGIVAGLGARAAADCAAAKDALAHHELTRASALARDCDADDPTPAQIANAAEAKRWSRVTIVTKPAGLAVALDGHADVALVGGDEVWLPPGTYMFTAGGMASTLSVKDGAHAVVLLEVPQGKTPVHDGSIDFGDEGGGTVVNGPPPKIVHPSLLPDRFQKGVDAKPSRESALEGQPVAMWPRWPDHAFAVMAGAGDSGSALAWSAAVAARTDWVQVEGAWLRRAVGDELALPVLLRHWWIRDHTFAISPSIGAQAEVRLDSGASRVGASAIAGLDAELRDPGLIVDLRGELGSTWAVGLRVGVTF
jgi:hypothetical protein